VTIYQARDSEGDGLTAFRAAKPRTPPPSSPVVAAAWLRGWDIGRCEAALGQMPTEREFAEWLARELEADQVERVLHATGNDVGATARVRDRFAGRGLG
jgi:hypothetical protein